MDRRSRTSPVIPFPGTPQASDLDILNEWAPATDNVLTADDIDDLKTLRADLNAICQRAQERGIRVIIDAEHRCVSLVLGAISSLKSKL